MRTRTFEGRFGGSGFPISLSVSGTPIGGASAIEEEVAGTFRFEGLDVLARVFFAERVGPGGPGDDITVRDVCVTDEGEKRTMRALEARVRHFSAGAGEL